MGVITLNFNLFNYYVYMCIYLDASLMPLVFARYLTHPIPQTYNNRPLLRWYV